MAEREDIFGRTEGEIRLITESLKLPAYTARQITDWLYHKGAVSFDGMSNLPKETRKLLEASYTIGRTGPSGAQVSSDGTKKYLFPVKAGKYIEAVYIPEPERATLCLSSQVGCKMGCIFCMTGRQGFQGNLSAGEILNQIVSLPETASLTNYVFMGMGEPLANTENILKSRGNSYLRLCLRHQSLPHHNFYNWHVARVGAGAYAEPLSHCNQPAFAIRGGKTFPHAGGKALPYPARG